MKPVSNTTIGRLYITKMGRSVHPMAEGEIVRIESETEDYITYTYQKLKFHGTFTQIRTFFFASTIPVVEGSYSEDSNE